LFYRSSIESAPDVDVDAADVDVDSTGDDSVKEAALRQRRESVLESFEKNQVKN
jgi:hypothetical protein